MSDIEKILYPSLPSHERPKNLVSAMHRFLFTAGIARYATQDALTFGLDDQVHPDDAKTHREELIETLQNAREAIDGLEHFMTPDNSDQGNLFDKGLTND